MRSSFTDATDQQESTPKKKKKKAKKKNKQETPEEQAALDKLTQARGQGKQGQNNKQVLVPLKVQTYTKIRN